MQEVAPGVFILQGMLVNVFLLKGREGECVLVDSGFSFWRAPIERALGELEQRGLKLCAVVVSHGHADHVGTARYFAEKHGVPIYAHRLELPFINGTSSYPPPDATIGGPHAFLSRIVDDRGRDLGPHLRSLEMGEAWCASEGEVPELPEWRWIHTPGHSPGHIALYRERDRVLIAGDAVGSVNFDTWRVFLAPKAEVWRGESPYISNWKQAESSVRLLARLQPEAVLCSHGPPLKGHGIAQQLGLFAAHYPFPSHGRYVKEGVRFDEAGNLILPPKPTDWPVVLGISVVLSALVGRGLARLIRTRSPGRPVRKAQEMPVGAIQRGQIRTNTAHGPQHPS